MKTEFKTQLIGTYRPLYNELSFYSTIEPLMDLRPLIILFVVDASHSMRFQIDKRKKSIQRQTLVQKAIKIALNNKSIVRDGDYVGLATFSTKAKLLLPDEILQMTQESRSSLDEIIENQLKSDGGQTNYGKAFKLTLDLFDSITKKLGSDSSLLTGPILVWFLTDGRPWPADSGNTEEDIMEWAEKIGASGNNLWMIGISKEADHQFLEKIVLKSQTGAIKYHQSLEGVPKEFMDQTTAARQTLWFDVAMETHEHLVYSLVNAIEDARINLGVVAELELNFYSEIPDVKLEFYSGVTSVIQEGPVTTVIVKRPNTVQIGQKLSIALSVKATDEILHHVRLQSVRYRFFRGSRKLEETNQILDQKLLNLVLTDKSKQLGINKVRKDLNSLKHKFNNHLDEVEELIKHVNKFDNSEVLLNYKNDVSNLKVKIKKHQGLPIFNKEGY